MTADTLENHNRRSVLLLCIAVLTSLLTLTISFVTLNGNQCAWMVRKTGYWGMASLLLLFVWFCRLEGKMRYPFRRLSSGDWMGVGVAFLCSLWSCVHHPFEYRILFDEYVIGNTALNFHIQSEARHGFMRPSQNGTSVPYMMTVDKRPVFFPFVLSVFHGAIGYSPNNVFILNVLLTIGLYVMLHFYVSWIAGYRWGIFCQVTLAGLPLLGLSSTSGGYEIMNLFLIVVMLISSLNYIKQEGPGGLNLMLASSLILANCRYESILYTLVPVCAVLYKWNRERILSLTWFSVFSPLFVIFPLMSNRVFYSNESFFQTSKDSFFGWVHFVNNFRAAGAFLFHMDGYLSNSLMLSILGIASIVIVGCMGCFAWRSTVKRVDRDILFVNLVLSILVIANTIMALCVFWGAWPDPTTSRFSLPLHLLMVVMIPMAWIALKGATKISIWVCLVPFFYLLIWGAPNSARQSILPKLPAAYAYNKTPEEVGMRCHKDTTLIVSEGCLGLTLGGYYSSNSQKSPRSQNTHRSMLVDLQESQIFSDVLFAEYHHEGPFGSAVGPSYRSVIPEFAILEKLESIRFNHDMEFRISRLVGMKMELPVTTIRDSSEDQTSPSVDDTAQAASGAAPST